MNGLSLRISRAGMSKSKNNINYQPVSIPNYYIGRLGENCNYINNFNKSLNTDDQLLILKNVFDELKETSDVKLISFLVTVFLQAEAKHPVKCFLTRQISKTCNLLERFAEVLSQEINTYVSVKVENYKQCVATVTKVATCIENFPAGAMAIKMIELKLAEYLKDCLTCCVRTLREESLSPTEKNEIFNLVHLVLRLLLYIVQKIEEGDVSALNGLLEDVKECIHKLLFLEDVPMDTKSVCGILYMTLYVLQNGTDSWLDVLQTNVKNNRHSKFLENEASELAIYSAIVIVVSSKKLNSRDIGHTPAILVLTEKILKIGERSSSESVLILGVTRTLLLISKMLDDVTSCEVGSRLIDCLLEFIWAHLEHYMDSVRHLTSQMMSCVVKYCTRLKRLGDETALNKLFAALTCLDKARKSYYLSLCPLANELGATAVFHRIPDLVCEVLLALNVQAVQASATTALEIFLQKHILESSTEDVHREWIEPMIKCVATDSLDSAVLSILENLMAKAVKMDENLISYIIPHIKQSTENNQKEDLKSVLILLSVFSRSGVTYKLSSDDNDSEWKGIISYRILELAAVDAVDETRILSLSLIVESPRSTELFTTGDLSFILHYLKYNINAQAPSFRQQTLSLMKKFMKRFEESYKAMKRQKLKHYKNYLSFVEDLRKVCFESLAPGANYSRRCVALQLLAWCARARLHGHDSIWTKEYIEKLLLHLEDSYEKNKEFALEVIESCPAELIKGDQRYISGADDRRSHGTSAHNISIRNHVGFLAMFSFTDQHVLPTFVLIWKNPDKYNYSISLDLDDVLRQASSLKPTDCVSAAYKLDVIRKKLPECILKDRSCSEIVDEVSYRLIERLVCNLRRELCSCHTSVIGAVRDAPMYGTLHCMGYLLNQIDPRAISGDSNWSKLIGDIIELCIEVNASVACVVNNSSPEGHLPMDMTGVQITDHGNSGGIKLDDGRPVTAQMVLLCGWRSVKEVSLLLGGISSRLSIAGEGQSAGTLTADQICAIGAHFTQLLAETKHRGAFEQAYVGFTMLLTRVWRCRSAGLHGLPGGWLARLLAAIASGEGGALCATRRSAGLPFMIQALVTSEVQVRGNAKSLEECVRTLMQLSGPPGGHGGPGVSERRAHCLNVLRALYRHSALHQHVAPYVEDGLRLALQGFDSTTWMERNSSTLLFSALMVRVFGVQRSRDADQLSVRNRMTGRIFFLRYPHLYDFILEKLKEVSASEDSQVLRPSLYPALLLLARLYPSSLEGTVSNLKLVAFVPHVLSCARSGVLKTRELAARAMVPLVSPEQYLSHIESMLNILNDKAIKRNYCHGILLQLARLLDNKPDVRLEEEARERLAMSLAGSLWILSQGCTPCWLVIDEFIKVLNLIVWRFPTLFDKGTTDAVQISLSQLLFDTDDSKITSGREVCLSNALYLYFVILHKYNKDMIIDLVYRSMLHTSYEVLLTVLNYLLILNKNLEIDNKFQGHLHEIADENVLVKLRQNDKYIKLICNLLSCEYIECKQKALRVLVSENDTQKYIADAEGEREIVEKLIEKIRDEHENLSHVYLESLSTFVTRKLEDLSSSLLLYVVRVMFDSMTADNNDAIRNVVVSFLEKNVEKLLGLDKKKLDEESRFECKATLLATVAVALEDDSDTLRQRTANAMLPVLGAVSHTLPNKCGEMLRDYLVACEDNVALLVTLALLDFKSEVCIVDEINDECKVFDQNEKYNIFLEETPWTVECVDKIIKDCKGRGRPSDYVLSIIDHPKYTKTIQKLCSNNLVTFKNLLEGREIKNEVVNPKITVFLSKLC